MELESPTHIKTALGSESKICIQIFQGPIVANQLCQVWVNFLMQELYWGFEIGTTLQNN